MTDKVCHYSKEIRVLSKFADHLNMLVTASVLLGIWLVLGSTAMPLVTIMSLYLLHGYTSSTTPVHRENNETSQMRDGIYLIEKKILGWTITTSINMV